MQTKVIVAKDNKFGIVPSEHYRVTPDLDVQVVHISQDGILSTGWGESVESPIRKGTFSSERLDIVVHKESTGRHAYSLVVKANQVIEAKKQAALLPDDSPASRQELDILGIAVNYIENPDHVFDTSKYLGRSLRSGKVFDKEASFSLMYVRGSAYLKGMIGDVKFEIIYYIHQNYMVRLEWDGQKKPQEQGFAPHHRKEALEYIARYVG